MEALSRGLERSHFHRSPSRELLCDQTKLKTLDLHSQSEVYRNDVHRALKVLVKKSQIKLILVFMDPPYHKKFAGPTIVHAF